MRMRVIMKGACRARGLIVSADVAKISKRLGTPASFLAQTESLRQDSASSAGKCAVVPVERH